MSRFPEALSLCAVCVCVWGLGRADQSCTSGSGRLVNGSDSFEGHLEVCLHDQWYRLCADGLVTEDAQVACRHLGFTTGDILYPSPYIPEDSKPILQVSIDCSGSEEDLYSCEIGDVQFNQCPSNEDVVIRCSYDYVPFLDSDFIKSQSSPNPFDVKRFQSEPLHFGEAVFDTFTVSASGYILFGESDLPNASDPSLPVSGDQYLLAPLWLQAAPPVLFLQPPVSVAITNTDTEQDIREGEHYLTQISKFIVNRTEAAFSAKWMAVAEWKIFPTLSDQQSNENGKFVSFQAVVLADHEDSYALYIYKCVPDLLRVSAIVGFSTPSFFQQFRYSGSKNTTYLGCTNQASANVSYFNLLYKLTDLENNALSQNTSEYFSSNTLRNGSSSTGEGSCSAGGFNTSSCCQPFQDPTVSCQAEPSTHSCYCDLLCLERKDCCADMCTDCLVEKYARFCVPSINPLDLSPSKSTGINFPSATSETSPSVMNSNSEPVLIVLLIVLALLVVIAVIATLSFTVVLYWKKRRKKMESSWTSLTRRTNAFSLSGINHYATDRNQLDYPLITAQQPNPVTSEYTNLFSSELIIHKNQLRLLDSIGRGEFGIVYKAHLFDFFDNSDNTIVAVKTLKGDFDAERVDDLLRESLKMKQFSHMNVMELYGVCLDASPAPFIVLPFMNGGSILQFLRSNRATYTLPELCDDNDQIAQTRTNLLAMCLQIARGMEYLTGQNFVHRDLAARNCMISIDGHIKVADFGLSKAITDRPYFRQDRVATVKLPLKWMALESIEDGIFSEKTDVWSFGVTSWEIFNGGRSPYPGVTPSDLPNMLVEGTRMDPPINPACSGEVYRMIMFRCWKADPNKRPSFTQIVSDIGTALNSMADYLDLNEMEAVQSLTATLRRYTTSLNHS